VPKATDDKTSARHAESMRVHRGHRDIAELGGGSRQSPARYVDWGQYFHFQPGTVVSRRRREYRTVARDSIEFQSLRNIEPTLPKKCWQEL
jgi:hypothetical protein